MEDQIDPAKVAEAYLNTHSSEEAWRYYNRSRAEVSYELFFAAWDCIYQYVELEESE